VISNQFIIGNPN